MKFDLDAMTEEEGLQLLLKRAAEKRQAEEKQAFDLSSLGQFANKYKPELIGGVLGGGLGALGGYAYGDDDNETASSRALRGLFGGMAGAGLGALGGKALGSLYESNIRPVERIDPISEAKKDVDAAASSIAPQSDLVNLVSEGTAGSGDWRVTGTPGIATGAAGAYAANRFLPQGVDQGLLADRVRRENADFESLRSQGKAVGSTADNIRNSLSTPADVPAHLRAYADYVAEWRNKSNNPLASRPPSFDEWVGAATKPTFITDSIGAASTAQKNTLDSLSSRLAVSSEHGAAKDTRSKLRQDVSQPGFFRRGEGYRLNRPAVMRAALGGALGSAVPDVLSMALPNLINTRGYGPGMATYNAVAPNSWVSEAELARRKNQLTAELAAEKLKTMFQPNRDK